MSSSSGFSQSHRQTRHKAFLNWYLSHRKYLHLKEQELWKWAPTAFCSAFFLKRASKIAKMAREAWLAVFHEKAQSTLLLLIDGSAHIKTFFIPHSNYAPEWQGTSLRMHKISCSTSCKDRCAYLSRHFTLDEWRYQGEISHSEQCFMPCMNSYVMSFAQRYKTVKISLFYLSPPSPSSREMQRYASTTASKPSNIFGWFKDDYRENDYRENALPLSL